jgi:acetyl-CoA carboxylase biotin carboxyl carrier protein
MKKQSKPQPAPRPTRTFIDADEVRGLVQIIEKSTLDELEIVKGDAKIRITRHTSGPAPVYMQSAASPAAAMPAAAAPAPAPKPAIAPGLPANQTEIKSPMVGTFYAAASPDAAPFVKEGDTVKKGQTLCIVEAMKIMNEIECELAGKIVKVLVKNAQPIEYNQPLFIIET